MDIFHKPQRFVCLLLAVAIIFAVNAPVFLNRSAALLPYLGDEDTDYSDQEDPVTEPTDPVTEPTDPVTSPNPWSEYTNDEPYSDPDPISSYTPYSQEDPYTDANNNTTTPSRYTQPQPDNTTGITYQPPTATTEPETTTAPGYIPSIIEHYSAVKEFYTDTQLDDQNIASADKDQNAVHIAGGNVIINNSNISRVNNASTGGENASHYGVGSVILATNGTGFISKTNINSEAKAAAGVFAYGNAKMYLADSTITTAMDGSHGLEAAETGKIYAWNLTVQTLGQGASPLFVGAGNGTFVLDGGSYASNGLKSPAIHCAGDVSIINGEYTAEQSEAAVVENGSTLTLCGVNLTGNMRLSEDYASQWTVLLYQSGEKDPAAQTNFYMKDGSLVSKAGGLFYTTNTKSNIYLENVAIKPFKNSDFLVCCTANADKVKWGSPMKNGAVCNLTAVNQQLEGNVIWDAISEMSLYVKDNSSFTGAFVRDDTYKTGKGFADLYIGEGCTWTVAGDSELSNLYNSGVITDTSGNTVTIKKSDGTVIAGGTSAYSIVVAAYQEKADMNGAQKAPDWSKTVAVRPAALGASLAEITTEETTESLTTPAQPDQLYERRKEIAKYVLIGVGCVAVAAAIFWLYQSKKYKLRKLLRGEK